MTVIEKREQGLGLSVIGKTLGLPSAATICRWRRENEKFADRWNAATEAALEAGLDETVLIADKKLDLTLDGHRLGALVQDKKVRIDARYKRAAVLAPKKFGQQKPTDGAVLVPTTVNVINYFESSRPQGAPVPAIAAAVHLPAPVVDVAPPGADRA